MITDDSIERHPALLQREESSWARGAQPLDLRAPDSRTATGSAACSEHARFSLTDCLHFSRCTWCPIPTPLDPPGASIMTACVRAAAVYALSLTVARVASLAYFAGFTIQADIANRTRRAHAAWLATYAQSTFQADQVDCARLALIAKGSCSAKFASSANPANPAMGKTTATADGLRGRRLGQRLGLPRRHLSVFHQRAISSSPPTNAPASHLLSPPARPRAQAPSTLNRTQLHR
jgi:hypothetical protein